MPRSRRRRGDFRCRSTHMAAASPLYVDGVSTAAKDGTFGVRRERRRRRLSWALGPTTAGRGREFTTSDSAGAPRVMIVSRRLATRLWPGKNPVGQRVRRGSCDGTGDHDRRRRGRRHVRRTRPDATVARLPAAAPAYRDWQTLIVHTRGDRRRRFRSCEASSRPPIRRCRCWRDDDGPTRRERLVDVANGGEQSRVSSARLRC